MIQGAWGAWVVGGDVVLSQGCGGMRVLRIQDAACSMQNARIQGQKRYEWMVAAEIVSLDFCLTFNRVIEGGGIT